MKIDFRKIVLEGAEYIYLAQDRNQTQAQVNTVVSFRLYKRQRTT